MPATVRDARPGDIPALIRLVAQLSPGDPHREDPTDPDLYGAMLQQIQEASGHQILVLEEGGALAGTLALSIIPNLSHRCRPYAIVENVVVDEAARSRGHGQSMLKEAIRRAREAGCYKISLTSNKRRTAAHRFYERLGFSRTHEAFRLNLE
jgi:ribosomal protein S18 acetylase RimI-like enzyme